MAPPDPADLAAGLNRGDDIDQPGPGLPETQERRRGGVRDNAPLPAGEGGGEQAALARHLRVAKAKGAGKDRVQVPAGNGTVDRVIPEPDATQLLPRHNPMLTPTEFPDDMPPPASAVP